MEIHDATFVRAVMSDWRTAPLDDRQRALLVYAEKLTKTPAAMTRDDLEPLRAAGLDDADILDLVQIIAYFNYINRVADALGVPPEPEWSDADLE